MHSGNVDAEAVLAGLTDSDSLAVPTLLGTELTISNGPDGLMIGDAMITVTDILADNGVIHQIDAVLLPPPATVVDVIAATPELSSLATAVAWSACSPVISPAFAAPF